MNKEALVARVKQALENEDIRYTTMEEEEERTILSFGLGMNNLCNHGFAHLMIEEDGIYVVTTQPMKAQQEHISATERYVLQAQKGMKHGHFDLDLEDGEVRFCHNLEAWWLSHYDHIELMHMLALGFKAFNRYGSGMVKVMLGFGAPEEEIAKARADD